MVRIRSFFGWSAAFLLLILAVPFTASVWGQTEGASAINIKETDFIMNGVVIRPGVTADINAKVFENTSASCYPTYGNTVMLIPGWWHTAASWRPFATTLMEKYSKFVWDGILITPNVCRVVAIDLPGHGRSSYPLSGAQFGDLQIDDYVAGIDGTLEKLHVSLGIWPSTVIGHEMGGLLIQRWQELLSANGSSLYNDFRIRKAILLSPAVPRAIPSMFYDSPAMLNSLKPYLYTQTGLGSFINPPAQLWVNTLFTGLSGDMSVNAPAADDVVKLGYIAPEPFNASFEVGTVTQRPQVSTGIFDRSNHTVLQIVAYENDYALLPKEAQALYDYLTLPGIVNRTVVLRGLDAVHDLHIADPAKVVAALDNIIKYPLLFSRADDSEY